MWHSTKSSADDFDHDLQIAQRSLTSNYLNDESVKEHNNPNFFSFDFCYILISTGCTIFWGSFLYNDMDRFTKWALWLASDAAQTMACFLK
jgi:hypothetical protein